MSRKNKFYLLLILIVILGGILRLRGFDHRFAFSGDVGRDLLVAKGAVMLGKLPWVGNFSSTGPYVFGPIYYWFVMLTLIVFPNYFFSPWLVVCAISLAFVIIMALAGRAAGGNRLGLVLALLSATSPLLIGYSFYLQQHELVLIFSGLALLGLVAYARQPRLRFAFIAGLGIGGGLSMHYQGLNLLAYVPAFYVVARPNLKRWLKLSVVLGIGILLPYLPLLIWDQTRNFKNTEQLIYFFRVGQYRFYVANRWLTYLGSFWPNFMGRIVGGNFWFGTVSGIGSSLVLAIILLRKKLSRVVILPIGVWILQIIMLRYYHGDRLDGYLIYFHPLIIFTVGAAMFYLVKLNRITGSIIVMLFLAGNIYYSNQYWTYDNDFSRLQKLAADIKKYYGGQKVAVYGHGLDTSNYTSPLSYLLVSMNIEDDRGITVGTCRFKVESCDTPGVREITRTEFQGEQMVVVDLSSVPKDSLTKKNNWYPFSILAMYDDVQNWWRKGL